MNRIYASIIFFPFLTGCLVGPGYNEPESKLPLEWDASNQQPESVSNKDLAFWWEHFEDQTLNSLIQRSIAGNLDLRQAASRIDASRAQFGLSNSRFFPQINAQGGFTRQFSDSNNVQSDYRSISSGGLDAAWEIDLFGSIRRDRESSLALLESSEENFKAVRLELAAQVASYYLELRARQEQLRIIGESLDLRTHQVRLVEQKFASGLTDAFDVATAKGDISNLQARLGPIQARRDELIYALSVLLGNPPEDLKEELSKDGVIPSAKQIEKLALPGEVIQRRPDVRRAAAELHAQTAQVGVATADLYPKLSLSGSFSFDRLKLGSASTDTRSWSLGPAISVPIFNGGRLISALDIQEAEREISFQAYQSTVLKALQDVETSLVRFGREQERKANLEVSVKENEKAARYAKELYSNGLADYFRVIQTQTLLLQSQEQLVDARFNVSSFLVAVYKSLGGGWED